MTQTTVPAPPPDAARFTRLLLGVGVSVPIALAPLLGNLPLPLFPALLSLIPNSIQGVVIPLSAMAMSIVALVVEAGTNRDAPKKRRVRLFIRSLMICSGLLLVFMVAYSTLVTRVDILGEKGQSLRDRVATSASFTLRTSRTSGMHCQVLTFRDTSIESYFGNMNLRMSSLALELLYVGFFASLGFLVACVMDLKQPAKIVQKKSEQRKRTLSSF